MQRQSFFFLVVFFLAIPFLCGFSDEKLSDIQTAIIEQDYAKAQTLAETFIATNPETTKVLEAEYYLGLSKLYLGQYAEARNRFQKILTAQPSRNLRDRSELGIIDSLLLSGGFEEALSRSQRLLRESPQSEYLSLIYFKIGRAHFKMAQWEDATKVLKYLRDHFPESPEAHLSEQLLAERHYFAVQVGSFLDRSLAEKLVEDMRAKDKYAYIVETIDKTSQTFYRVRVGQFSRLDEAMALAKRLTQLGYPTLIYP